MREKKELKVPFFHYFVYTLMHFNDMTILGHEKLVIITQSMNCPFALYKFNVCVIRLGHLMRGIDQTFLANFLENIQVQPTV